MHRPVIVSPPQMLPVSLAEVKLQQRVDHNDDDALIEGLIRAATEHLSGWTGILGRCLVEQELRQDFDACAPCLSLCLGPVINITSVTVAGNPVDSGSYSLRVGAGGCACVEFAGVPASGPASVIYKAGYETILGSEGVPARSTVPEPLKLAILLLAGHWYQNRDASTSTPSSKIPFGVEALIAPYRRIGV